MLSDAVASLLNTATTPAATAAAAGASAAGTAASKTITQGDFLHLFIAQLQNQDPLSPLDPDQMTAQLAQFSSLEQLTGVNTRLDSLTSLSRNSILGLIGKEIRFDGGKIGVASGQAPGVHYTLSDRAGTVTATVTTADGTPVRVVQLGAQDAGDHVFQFDGRNASGTTVADGTYNVEISATGTDGKTPVQADLSVQDVVDGVDLSSDPPAVMVGTLRIPLDQVREVHLAGTQTGQGS
jgi:flagellar basal-body rod modification protein FlgD